MDKIPDGYERIDGKLVPKPVETEIVKWVFATMLTYTDHPPVSLVMSTINKFRELYNEELTYEEAEAKVPYSDILDYMTNELNTKTKLFQATTSDESVEALKGILDMPYEEAKEKAEALNLKIGIKPFNYDHYSMPLQQLYKAVVKADYKAISSRGHGHIISHGEFAAAIKKRAAKRAGASGIVVSDDNMVLSEGGALCNVCGQRKLIADGCTCSQVELNGKKYARIPYGEEDFEWLNDCCHDCGARPGFYHHPGCDVEECPICGEQLIGCNCDIEFLTDEE